MTGTTITDVTVLRYPNGGGRDLEINSAALPQLVQQAMAVQSADTSNALGCDLHLDRGHPVVAERVGPSVMTKHTEHVMGTVFSIHVADEGDWGAAISEVVADLHWVDETFSTYRPESQINRLRRAESRLVDYGATSPWLRQGSPSVAVTSWIRGPAVYLADWRASR